MIHNVTLTANCMNCNTEDRVTVTTHDYQQYSWGNKLVQNVWPTLSTWDRDIIIGFRTGLYQCQACFEYDPIDDIIKESETTGEY